MQIFVTISREKSVAVLSFVLTFTSQGGISRTNVFSFAFSARLLQKENKTKLIDPIYDINIIAGRSLYQ